MELEKCSICGGEAEFLFLKPSILCNHYGKLTGVELYFTVKCKNCGRRIESHSISIEFSPYGGIKEIHLDAFDKAADKWNKDNTPTTDWTKVQVDTPIYVRDHIDDFWKHRYFAKFKNGKVYTWCDGRTSFSVDGDDVIPWKYAKLSDEE